MKVRPGKAWGWGYNDDGGVGTGSTYPQLISSPTKLMGDHIFTSITARQSQVGYGLTEDGRAYVWGYDWTNTLGDGTTYRRTFAVPVIGGYTFSKIYAGSNLTLAIATDGVAYGWGYNAYGEVGDNSDTLRSSPVVIAGDLEFSTLSAGQGDQSHSLGLTKDGKVYAWGSDWDGQLGTNSIGNCASSPVAVIGLDDVEIAQVSAGWRCSLAIDTSGRLYAWGNNVFAKLGTGDTKTYSSPVLVNTDVRFKSIFAGQAQSCGLTTDGDFCAWGNTQNGVLGDGGTSNYSTPTVAVHEQKFTRLSFRNGVVAGITADKKGYTWGTKYSTGPVQYNLTPTMVSNDLYFSDIAVGGQNTFGIEHVNRRVVARKHTP